MPDLNNIIQYFRNLGSPIVRRGGPGLVADQYIDKPQAEASDYSAEPVAPMVTTYTTEAPFGGPIGQLLKNLGFGPTTVRGTRENVSPAVDAASAAEPYVSQTAEAVQRILEPWIINDKAPIPPEVANDVFFVADKYGIDPRILASLLANESGGYATPYNIPGDVTGASGEVGNTQIIPQFHYNKFGYTSPADFETFLRGASLRDQLDATGRILSDNINVSGGDVFQGLSRYNAGGSYEYGYPYAAAAYQRVGLPLPPYYTGR